MSDTPHNLTEDSYSPEDIQLMLDNFNIYTVEEKEEIEVLADALEKNRQIKACYDDLIEFCKLMQPDYKVGRHHRLLADLLMEIEEGRAYDEEGTPLPETGKDRILSLIHI